MFSYQCNSTIPDATLLNHRNQLVHNKTIINPILVQINRRSLLNPLSFTFLRIIILSDYYWLFTPFTQLKKISRHMISQYGQLFTIKIGYYTMHQWRECSVVRLKNNIFNRILIVYVILEMSSAGRSSTYVQQNIRPLQKAWTNVKLIGSQF